MKRLNLKLLIFVLVGGVVLVAGVHILHAVQVKRNAGSVLAQAETAKKDGKVEDARRLYKQYLTLNPDDEQTYSKLALVSAEYAALPEATLRDHKIAYDDLNKAAIKDPDNAEIHRKLADECIRLTGQYADAATHLTAALKSTPDDPELLVKLADCKAHTDRRDEAVAILQSLVGYDPAKKTFDPAKAKAPNFLDAYVALAEILSRRPEDPDTADLVMNRLVEVNNDKGEAYLKRAGFNTRHRLTKDPSIRAKMLASVKTDLDNALKLDPDNSDALLLAAETTLQSATSAEDLDAHVAEARKYLERGVEKYPKIDRFHLTLALTYFSEASQLAVDFTKTKDPKGELRKAKLDEALARINVGLSECPKSIALLQTKVRILLQRNELKEVSAALRQLQEAYAHPALVNFYEGQLLAKEEKWSEASKKLERARPQLIQLFPSGDVTNECDFLLGQCYERLQQPDLQLEAYQRVKQSDPMNIRARVGLALALAATGQADDSLRELQFIRSRLSNDQFFNLPLIWQLYLKLQIADQMRRPEEQRDWTEVNAIQAETQRRNILDVGQQAILKAESFQVKGDFDQAKQILLDAQKQQPKDPTLWFALASLEQRAKGSAAGLAVLDQAQKELGDSVTMRVMRAESLARGGGANLKKLLTDLEQNADQFSETDRVRLWQSLGEVYYSLRETADAQRLWRKVAQLRPDDTRVRLGLFQLARETGDPAGMQAALDDLREKFGKDSAEWKLAEAMRLIDEATKKSAPENLNKARALLQEAGDKRPGWHEVARLQAQIQIMEGNTEGAITSLERALELGPPNPAVVRQLASLYANKGAYKEARRALNLTPPTQRTADMKKMEAQIELGLNNNVGALALAAEAVKMSPDTWETQWWYGQLLERAEEHEGAEKAFRRAVLLGGENPETWRALVTQLAARRKGNEAREVLRDAAAKLPPDQLTWLMAQGQEALGDLSQAQHYYEQALQEKPGDLETAQFVARFYLRNRMSEKAKPVLSQIIDIPTVNEDRSNREIHAWARREMARLLAASNIYHEQEKAIALIDANARDGKLSDEDLSFKATILAGRTDPDSRRKATVILEDLWQRGKLRDTESLLLAQLYDSAGSWSKARSQLSTIMSKMPDNVPLMTKYAQILLMRDEVNEAANWINRLESFPSAKLAPDTLVLKARLLVKQNKQREATQVLNSMLPQPLPPDQIDRVAAVAQQFEQLKLYGEAEKLYRRYVELNPQGKLVLAQFLGQHGSLSEALDLCDQARTTANPLAVISVAVASIRDRQADAKTEHYDRVEQWINKAVLQEPGFHPLELRSAEFKELQGKYAEVEKIYRGMIDASDIDEMIKGVALNNLAYILAIQEPPKDGALPYLEQSMNILGPVRDLLDTRAMVYLAKGDTKQALTDMNVIFTEFNLNDLSDKSFGVKYFHLALVKQKAGDMTGAKDAMERAQKYGLTAADITVTERKRFETLARDLGLKDQRAQQ